jgi:monoamine oxidase
MIPMKMVEWLKKHSHRTNIRTRYRVTCVEFNGSDFTISGLRNSMRPGDPSSFEEKYSHIIFAIPPPCIRMIDLKSCELDYDQRNALRELQLAPSSKIGMKFKTAWWTGPNGDIVGGQSTTDRVARTIVYPSQGNGKSTVLIVSYAWSKCSNHR